jgi:pilus assembly protein CpaF
MSEPAESKTARLATAELGRLKRYMMDALSRGIESEAVSNDQRAAFIQQHLKDVYEQSRISIPQDLQRTVFQDVQNELMGYGPIQPLLDDPEVTEVMVNGPKRIYVEKLGKIIRTNLAFDDDAHVMRIIERVILPLGRHVDADSPTVDGRLPDGSRVNAVVRPAAARPPSGIL